MMPYNGENKTSAGAVNLAILTREEAAGYLRCTTKYIDNQIRAGRLRACKPSGKFVRLYLRDIDAFLSSGSSIG
jgi:excisionase family DNA binding protein